MAADKKSYLIEFIGTFFLCFHIFCSGTTVDNSMGMICGYMIFIMIAAKVSGAHFNPGITMGMVVMGYCNAMNFFMYFLMHIMASVAAAGLRTLLLGGGNSKHGDPFNSNDMIVLFIYYAGAQIILTVIYMIIAVNSKAPRAAFCFCVPLAQLFVSTFSTMPGFVLLGNCSVIFGAVLFNQHWGALISTTLGSIVGGGLGGLIYKVAFAD